MKRRTDMQMRKRKHPYIKTDVNFNISIFTWRKGDGVKVGPHKFSQNKCVCQSVCVICGSTATCWVGRRRTAVRIGQLLYSSVQCCASQVPPAGDSSSSPVSWGQWTPQQLLPLLLDSSSPWPQLFSYQYTSCSSSLYTCQWNKHKRSAASRIVSHQQCSPEQLSLHVTIRHAGCVLFFKKNYYFFYKENIKKNINSEMMLPT